MTQAADPASPAGEAHGGSKSAMGRSRTVLHGTGGTRGDLPFLKIQSSPIPVCWPALPTCAFLPSATRLWPGSLKRGLSPWDQHKARGQCGSIQGSEPGKSPMELGFVLHPWQSITQGWPPPSRAFQHALNWKCQYSKGHQEDWKFQSSHCTALPSAPSPSARLGSLG